MNKKMYGLVVGALALMLTGCRPNSEVQTLQGHIIDVVRGTITDGEIEIADGRIRAIHACGVPDSAPYYLPGFVDAHVHIESAMMLPEEFARTARRHGTIGAVCDPHEIANVLGVRGVELMLEDAKHSDFYFAFAAPSCVPSCGSDIETSGATLDSTAIRSLMQRDEIYALAEMMNYPGVLQKDPQVMAKIAAAREAGKPVDGHAPGLRGEQRRQYAAAGISTDHECSTFEEGLEAAEAGMYILIREGSAAKDYEPLHELIRIRPRQVMFATDDAHPTDFMDHHINNQVRMALADTMPLMDVLRAACLYPVEHYRIPSGLLQVGDPADLIAISDTTPDFRVLATYIRGRELSHESYREPAIHVEDWMRVCHAKPITSADLQVAHTGIVDQIVARDRSLLTEHYRGVVDAQSQKIVTYNRYTDAKPQVAYIRGFELTHGAWAQTIAHDCHNIIAVGTDDELLVEVINRVIELGGGIVVNDGQQQVELPLPIAGLLSDRSTEELAEKNRQIEDLIHSMGCRMGAPVITLGFMALPVIPQLKLTDKGLFNSETWSMIR